MKHEFDRGTRKWFGIEPKGYLAGTIDEPGQGYRGVTKHVISGDRGDLASFEVRYFEVEPDGYTRLEKHQHVHSVTIIRGHGYAIVGDQAHPLAPFDHIYVGPMTIHQFVNDRADEPLGFICVVDAQRDRPQPATDDEARELSAAGLNGKVRR
ncbi:MAG TPA: cupin domain-containing protein [Candidatus Eremiobacteraceae bacterium]|nr:cupin domain-containing protein [Candidatus Eremiobacteraceae bacterium]